jgi:hypothetical protein
VQDEEIVLDTLNGNASISILRIAFHTGFPPVWRIFRFVHYNCRDKVHTE